ncbi:MAG: DUF86 domain-containing protein [Acidobacteriota bacterium]
MTKTEVDLKIVLDRLSIVRQAVVDLRTLPSESFQVFAADRRNIFAADALLRRSIEALFDTAKHLLARAHGLGKLQYRETGKLAGERGLVADSKMVTQFVRMGGFRNRLVHHYDDLTPEELFGIVTRHLADLEGIADELHRAAIRLAD